MELPRLVEALKRGVVLCGNMPFLKQMTETLFHGDFSPRFALNLACKDYGLASELTVQHEVPTQLIDLCQRELSEALRRGWGEQDRTIASTLQEERSNAELRLT